MYTEKKLLLDTASGAGGTILLYGRGTDGIAGATTPSARLGPREGYQWLIDQLQVDVGWPGGTTNGSFLCALSHDDSMAEQASGLARFVLSVIVHAEQFASIPIIGGGLAIHNDPTLISGSWVGAQARTLHLVYPNRLVLNLTSNVGATITALTKIRYMEARIGECFNYPEGM